MNELKVFCGDEKSQFGKAICDLLKITEGEMYRHNFPSGERYVQFKENERGADVFLIRSTHLSTNDALMQLLIMADAARRASAGRITAVLPMLFYQRQDRKDKSRVPISAKLVLDLIAASGIDRVVTMDLHAPQIAGFTNLPFDHLYFQTSLEQYTKDLNITPSSPRILVQ